MITLRDYQNVMTDGARRSFAEGKRAPLVVAPTGSGKTTVFSYIAHMASAKGNRVLIIAHRNRLIKQTSATLDAFGVPHGIIAAGMSGDIHHHVQIASVQTLVRRMHKLPWWPDLILVDEGHHATGTTTWGKVIKYYHDARIIGFTATPERLDGQGLGVNAGGIYDDLVMGPQASELIKMGHLSKPVVYGAPNPIDTSQMHTRMGDWKKDEAEAAVDKPRITGDAVEHYRKLAHNEPAIAFCASIAHAEHVAEEFRQQGYQAAAINGKLKIAEQNRLIDDLGNGNLKVLTSCDLISEGTDVPIVSVGIMLRLTQSLALAIQQGGRILRPFEGKKRALILDHVNNWERHGFLDDEREWDLNGEKRSKRKKDDEVDIKTKQCPECYHTHRVAPQCPECGYVYTVKGRGLEKVDGQLEELDPATIRKNRQVKLKKARTREELEAVASEMGFKPGWVDYTLKARQAAHERYKYGGRRRA